MMTLANKLTMVRGGLGLLTFACLWLRPPHFTAAFSLYIAATLTDWIDGYVARLEKSVTAFGAVADPIADKVLVIGALIALSRVRSLEIPVWAVFLIIVRELVIGGLRSLAGGQGKILSAERWGKWKMGIQSACVITLLAIAVLTLELGYDLPDWLDESPPVLVIVSLAVTWASAGLYLLQNRKLLQASWAPPRRR